MSTRKTTGSDVVIVVLIVFFALVVLLPLIANTLRRPRCRAQGVVCGSNLKGIGTAMQVYANDGDGKFPTIHSPNDTSADITACFYMLVRGEYTTPAQFVCRGDADVEELWLDSEHWDGPPPTEFRDANDFGINPASHVSYAYHCPIPPYLLSQASDPRLAVAADRNPFCPGKDRQTIGQKADDYWWKAPEGTIPRYSETGPSIKEGNCMLHQRDGQNVLFSDNSVSFEKEPHCGLDDDNIYTPMTVDTEEGRKLGARPNLSSKPLVKDRDSVLLSENP